MREPPSCPFLHHTHTRTYPAQQLLGCFPSAPAGGREVAGVGGGEVAAPHTDASGAAASSCSETSVYPNKRALFSSGKNSALRAAGETAGIPPYTTTKNVASEIKWRKLCFTRSKHVWPSLVGGKKTETKNQKIVHRFNEPLR